MEIPRKKNLALNRRQALAGFSSAAAIVGLGASSAATANTISSSFGDRQWTSEFLKYDKVEHFRQAMRLQRSLIDDSDVLHWYHFLMIAVPATGSPRPVVRWEGIELSHHRKLRENVYRVHGHNLSFPRDMETGEFVDGVKNPLTGKYVRVPPLALTSDPGLIATPDGIVSLDSRDFSLRKKYGVIRREGNAVKIDGIRVPPASWPATFIEVGHEASPSELYDDRSKLWLPSDVSGAYVFPYPAWMDMGDAPGHMFATWSGYKVRSIDQLPAAYKERALAEYPHLLHVDLAQFEKPFDISRLKLS